MRVRNAVILLFAIGSACISASASDLTGDWTGPTKSVVRIFQCGSEICLKIVKLGPNTPETRDRQNPDERLRTRPLCGLVIGSGFKSSDGVHATGGHLYDPESGKTYRGIMTAVANELQLRGYVGIPLLGRSETWHRTAQINNACSA